MVVALNSTVGCQPILIERKSDMDPGHKAGNMLIFLEKVARRTTWEICLAWFCFHLIPYPISILFALGGMRVAPLIRLPTDWSSAIKLLQCKGVPTMDASFWYAGPSKLSESMQNTVEWDVFVRECKRWSCWSRVGDIYAAVYVAAARFPLIKTL